MHDRRRRARHRRRVDHEHDRRPQQLGHVRGGGELAPPRRAVEQPHHALDHRDVGAGAAVARQGRDQLRPGEERVEVPPRPPGGQRVVARVDVVGPDLEALHAQPARAQRPDQPARDRRLAGARARPRDDDARDHHSIPCCARMPASNGCLTLTTSETRSAASISALRRVAAGEHHVLEARPVAQRGHDVVERDPLPVDRIGDLVQQEELVALRGDRPLDPRPALARQRRRLVQVLGQPRPAVAHLLPVDPAELRGRLGLADLPLARLDELEDAAAVAARPRAHEHPERRRALALARAGDDDHQRPVAGLAPPGLGAAAVLGHAARLAGASACTRPPAAAASARA